MKFKKFSLSVTAACFSLLLFTSPANAQPLRTSSPKPTLPPGRMRSCEARALAVQTRLSQLLRLTTNMLDVFNTHAKRIMDFYTNVILPSGKTVPNYDTLIANIDTKKTAVETAWTKAKAGADAFSCTTGDPRQLLNQFRLDMIATKRALKDYRTAIKNLIVAVKRVTPAESPTPSPSPTP